MSLIWREDSACSFGDFADKVEAWKKNTGITVSDNYLAERIKAF